MIEILNVLDDEIYKAKANSTRKAVERAVKNKINLSRANLTGANLFGARLTGANLQGADLSGANLRGADLFRANLQRADLTGADLTGACLSEANLQGANLSETNLTGANLSGTIGLLPNGLIPLQIFGSRHSLIVREAGYITIGCHHFTIAEWKRQGHRIGRIKGYTPDQIEEYEMHIKYATRWMKINNVDQVIEKGEKQ